MRYLLVVNASNKEKDWAWIQQQNQNFGAKLEDVSEATALLAIQGPSALEAMQKLTPVELKKLPFYAHTTGEFAGCKQTLIATTGYTGAGGIEIYFPAAQAPQIWEAILDAGAAYDILPAGLAARDTLRIEMGYCLYGNEIDETTSPIAAGLKWITKPETASVNAKQLAKEIEVGTSTKLIGFLMEGRAIPRAGHEIINQDNQIIGRVTSGTQSPSLAQGIGLGYIQTAYSEPGTQVGVEIREKYCSATIVRLPFIKG